MARELSLPCLAFCLVVATCLAVPTRISGAQPPQDSLGNIDVLGGKGESPPKLVFACDGSPSALERIFSQPEVISDLKELNAGISLALPDLNAERAQLVLRLNQASIPVTAWLALPPAQGYYSNASNAPETFTRFADFEKWSAAYGLRWAAVGLDIEPSIQDFALLKGSKWRLAWIIFGRYFELRRVQRAKDAYAALVREIQAHGYPVETYQFPFIADERRVHSTLLERLSGIVDISSDREVLMLYTSFNPALDSGLIWVYGPEAQAIAVGSTSGPEYDPHFVRLNWDRFSRDLIVAHHFSRLIGVYNLAGCVQQGFLHRLQSLDWDQSVVIPAASVRKALQLRKRVQTVIWLGSHLPYFAILIFIVGVTAIGCWRTRRRSSVIQDA